MRFRILRPLATVLCLAAVLSGGMASPRGYILCLGADGHVEFSSTERECGGCETPGADAGPPSEGSGLSRSDECCPCLDIPVLSGGEILRADSPRPAVELTASIPGPLAADLIAFEGPKTPLRISPHDPPVASRFVLSQLRSVILVV